MVSKYQWWNFVRTMKHSWRQSIAKDTMINAAVDSFAPLQCIDCELLSLVRFDATEPFLLSNYMKRWITGGTNTLYYSSKCCCNYYWMCCCFLRCSLFVTETSPIVGCDVFSLMKCQRSPSPKTKNVTIITGSTTSSTSTSSNKLQRIDKRKWLYYLRQVIC